MAIFYTDVALNQQQNLNFPGFPGSLTLTSQPGSQNNPLVEGPLGITGTYTWAGTEAAGDIINIGILPAGAMVIPTGVAVRSGTSAPASTLTVAIGDNDLALVTAQPIPNSMVPVDAIVPNQAPKWVSGTTWAKGNVAYDPNSTPANQVFTCIVANSGTTAPSSDATNWIANQKRYSTSIDIHGASGNVAAAGGTQFYGGPMSVLPYSTVPGTAVPTGAATANQIANSQYQIQQDCWAQAVILTISTPVAGTVSVFRVPYEAAN